MYKVKIQLLLLFFVVVWLLLYFFLSLFRMSYIVHTNSISFEMSCIIILTMSRLSWFLLSPLFLPLRHRCSCLLLHQNTYTNYKISCIFVGWRFSIHVQTNLSYRKGSFCLRKPKKKKNTENRIQRKKYYTNDNTSCHFQSYRKLYALVNRG